MFKPSPNYVGVGPVLHYSRMKYIVLAIYVKCAENNLIILYFSAYVKF